jgi:hypothetical protein
MNIIKSLIKRIKNLWGKWTFVQKLILFSIIAVVVIDCVLFLFILPSHKRIPDNFKTSASLFSMPIRDEIILERIISRINHEGYSCSVSADGIIMLENAEIVRKMRAIMIMEDLIPINNEDVWDIQYTKFPLEKEEILLFILPLIFPVAVASYLIVKIYLKVKLRDFASVLFSSIILIFIILITVLYIYLLIMNNEINIDKWIIVILLPSTFLYIYPFYFLIKKNIYNKYINIILLTLYSMLFIIIIIIPWIDIIKNK